MPDIFLSYSRDDQGTARRFAEGFEREGFSVWWDQTLNAGEDYDEVTERALEEARAVVVLWSKKSVASRWVRAEATQADRNGTLVPAMIESCKRPIMFELKQSADLSNWKGDQNDRTWQAYLASVRRLVEKDRPVAPAATVVNSPRAASARFKPKSLAIAAAVLIGAVGLVWAITRARDEHPPVAAPRATANSTTVTLAVLPFVNLSSDPEQEYFSDGLSEELLNQLAQIKEMRVAGRTSSFSFKGKNEDLRVIGEKLGVANILEGSVRKSGKQLRITAQLINTRDGTHLWSQTFSRELNDVFAIQEEIAVAVSRALSITLDVGAMSRARGGTTNVAAYDKYLRARTLWLGVAQPLEAVELFRESVALDPLYARAWYALWDALHWVPQTPITSSELAAAAARVLALTPDAWWSNVIRADQLAAEREWFRAEAAARAAVAEQPSSEFEAGTMLYSVLSRVGRQREGARYFERARQLEPTSLGISAILQNAYLTTGNLGAAQEEYRRGKSLAGDRRRSEFYALLSLWRSKDVKPAAVAAQFRVVLQLDTPPNPLNQALLPVLSDKAAARAVIRKAFDDPSPQQGGRTGLIALYADHFGDKERALMALRRHIFDLGNNPSILWLAWESDLRSDPRFKEMLRELKIVDYWRASGNWGDFCKPVGSDDFECH
jgi:TolB-like protein